MTDQSPRERVRANTTELASLAVTGFWLVALLTGQEWWLVALLVGYVVVVPLVEILFGEDEERADAVETASSETEETPLERLRRRYAEGELTDDQFERKLERLLETETLENAADSTTIRESERN
ncbi:MAG: SHOCT domain-containing protein [Haloarcula sp.]